MVKVETDNFFSFTYHKDLIDLWHKRTVALVIPMKATQWHMKPK